MPDQDESRESFYWRASQKKGNEWAIGGEGALQPFGNIIGAEEVVLRLVEEHNKAVSALKEEIEETTLACRVLEAGIRALGLGAGRDSDEITDLVETFAVLGEDIKDLVGRRRGDG